MGIGGRIRDWVNDQAEEWGERFGIFVGNVFGRGSREAYEEMPPELRKAILEVMEAIMTRSGSDTLRELLASDTELKDMGKNPGIGVSSGRVSDNEILLMALSQVGALIGAPLGLFPLVMDVYTAGFGELYKNMARQIYEPTRLDPREYIAAEWRNAIDSGKLSKDLSDLGYSSERVNQLRESLRPLLDPATVRLLGLRFPDLDTFGRHELEQAGYKPQQIDALERLHPIIPPLPDMVRFADFGSFDPNIIEAWREYYDAPGWITEPFKLLGVENAGALDWANKYWFSHWVQPGRFELGEMHRRGLLGGRPLGATRPETKAEREAADSIVRKAYLTQGYSSYWQSRLLDLVGENLTRVDIRRMHKLEVLDDEQLSDAYHRIGYYGANNAHMVQFTKAYNATADRDLTATEILKSYRRKTIDRDTALELLQEIGYGETEADFKLTAEDAGSSEAERTLSEAKLKTLYLAGVMPKPEATGELQAKGYDAQEIAYLFTLWDLDAIPATRLPTRSELSHFLAEGILTEGEFTSWMQQIGYPPQHINWYMEEYTADLAEAARREEEAALAESERIERATAKTEYMTARSVIDVRIAEAKVFIADAKRSLLDIGTDAERAALRLLGERERKDLSRLSLEARQAIAFMAMELRIAARGATDKEKAILERATMADRQAIESLTLDEREVVSLLALAESEAVRDEVSAIRGELRKSIADADLQIARLKVDKAGLKLSPEV